MEIMEEGNLMDRVPILLQRDLQFYQTHQRVLQEPICPAVVGGKLDFPRYASFAAVKIILWWEDEYFASHRKYSGLLHTQEELTDIDLAAVIVKNSDPDKFVSLVTKSADLLLHHLHVLCQESLDHADLSVLSATIGAAALVRNCLYAYFQAATIKSSAPKRHVKGSALKLSYKKYSQMAEALAESLLDVHRRLLLLYILQDADCVYWEDSETFFESERGSFSVQMWWNYMVGTKDDLWNSVPPKMARRIFSGILNESLTVLAVRYSQIITNNVRSQLHIVDICNLLLCVIELLPFVSDCGESYIGLQSANQVAAVRNIHSKCRELFYSLLLRGPSLGVLTKIFQKGVDSRSMFASRQGLPSSWVIFALPNIFPKSESSQWVTEFTDLRTNAAILLELTVLLALPEADWSFLVKVWLMRDGFLIGEVLRHLLQNLSTPLKCANGRTHPGDGGDKYEKCKAFLCRQECFDISKSASTTESNYQIILSLTYLIVAAGKTGDIKSYLVKSLEDARSMNWSDCLDKRQVWNQKRPPWMEAMVFFVYPVVNSIVEILVNAVDAGASTYQVMSLAITCITEIWNCIPEGLFKTTTLLQDVLPVSTRPLNDSVLVHVIFASLFTNLIKTGDYFQKQEDSKRAAICFSISEAICSIDKDDKHTHQIQLFLEQVQNQLAFDSDYSIDCNDCQDDIGGFSMMSTLKMDDETSVEYDRLSNNPLINFAMEFDVGISADVLASDVLATNRGKQALKILYSYMKNNRDVLMKHLHTSSGMDSNPWKNMEEQKLINCRSSILKNMFFIGNNPFDQIFTGLLNIDFTSWLLTPLSINPDRAWLHLFRRCDFKDEEKLDSSEIAMTASIKKFMKERIDSCK